MAIYHCSIKIISRGKGKSAAAAAAYRSGEVIKNEYDGVTHDYTAKRGIVHTEILLPDHAPTEYADRAVLWNAKQDGNPHAHIMLTMRPIEKDGNWGQKSRTENGIKIPTVDWNEQTKAEEWRSSWADMCNQYLERGNHAERIDHRSYERQGIEQIPTVHLGVAASQMERRGIRTERGNLNREVEISNKHLQEIKARLAKLQTWLKEEMANTEPPMLADVIQNILNRQHGYYSSIHSLKQAANIHNFLITNHIKDMADLDKYFKAMIFKREALGKKLKPIERRLETLEKHIDQAEKYQQYRPYKVKYDKLYAECENLKNAKGFGAGRKAQKALDSDNEYHETHRMEITLCQSAERYLKDVLNGRDKIPLPTWKSERDKLNAERKQLDTEYKQLKADTAAVEKIRSNIYDIVRQEQREQQPRRAQDMEL